MMLQENVETRIYLNKFKPRSFQYRLFRAFERDKKRKLVCIWPRRSGKDVCAFNLTIREAIRKVGVYYYIFPTYSQARKVIWDSLTNDGKRFLDFIPKGLIKATNTQQMKITLINNSIIQLIGSDNIDSIVGSNPSGAVFSEYALQDSRAYQFIRPIFAANGGWALFVSTPRGKNHLWELYQLAKESPDWFCYRLTLDDTCHIPLVEVEKERKEGLMSEDLIQQEYYTSFTMGVEGSYYAKYIDRMKLNSQISTIPWEGGFKVHTAWDLGVRDSTAIIFFQIIGQAIRIIDYYENSKEGLEYYIRVIREKPYIYGKHIAPHDIKVKEFGSGLTRLNKARNLGINFTVAERLSIADGIEAVRSSFSKIWIDTSNCSLLIKALENYRQEYDSKRKIYNSGPRHDWSSHAADAMRYLCISLPKTRAGTTADELDKRYNEAMYGNETNLPPIFRDDFN